MPLWILVVAAAGVSSEAAACPVCDTETGVAVRAGIFDQNFWGRAASIVAPFPFLVGIVAAIHFGGRRGRSGSSLD